MKRSVQRLTPEEMFPHEFLTQPPGSLSVHDPHWRDNDKSFRRSYRNRYASDAHSHDVSHLISLNNGGVNAVENAGLTPSKFNRSIKDKGDHLNCALFGMRRCKVGVDASRRRGSYKGKPAPVLHREGKRTFEANGILVHPDGGVIRCLPHARSPAFESLCSVVKNKLPVRPTSSRRRATSSSRRATSSRRRPTSSARSLLPSYQKHHTRRTDTF